MNKRILFAAISVALLGSAAVGLLAGLAARHGRVVHV